MNDFESNVKTALSVFFETIKKAADKEIERINIKITNADEKLREAERLKLKENDLIQKEQELNSREAFIKKREEADKERKLTLDMQEKRLTAEKTRISNLINSM